MGLQDCSLDDARAKGWQGRGGAVGSRKMQEPDRLVTLSPPVRACLVTSITNIQILCLCKSCKIEITISANYAGHSMYRQVQCMALMHCSCMHPAWTLTSNCDKYLLPPALCCIYQMTHDHMACHFHHCCCLAASPTIHHCSFETHASSLPSCSLISLSKLIGCTS